MWQGEEVWLGKSVWEGRSVWCGERGGVVREVCVMRESVVS